MSARPIYNEGLSLDGFRGNESPVPAILTVFSVIPHNKVVAIGHGNRAKCTCSCRVAPGFARIFIIPVMVI